MRAFGNGNPALCANNLLRIARGEVPFERVKGLNPRLIDRPLTTVEPQLRQDAEWLISTYEPRASVEKIQIIQEDRAAGGFIVTADIK